MPFVSFSNKYSLFDDVEVAECDENEKSAWSEQQHA